MYDDNDNVIITINIEHENYFQLLLGQVQYYCYDNFNGNFLNERKGVMMKSSTSY